MTKADSYVLDSYALIGYLEDEPFAESIQGLLLAARKKQPKLFLHAVQLGEVYCITLREQGRQTADLAYARIKNFPLSLIDTIDEKLLLSAASIKASFPLSYADAFAAATAQCNDAVLLTGDPEFKALEAKGIISVRWLNERA
jgi:predicted nucleic acid-binding protein